MPSPDFRAFRIHNDDDGYRAGIETMSVDALSPGEVLVKSAWSSVNFKDALAGTGKGKILRRYPLNGGIDVAGHVVASTDPAFKEGDAVLCTGAGLSETRDGGFGQYVRLESRWTIPLPNGLSLRESMILGTAGFTAALALLQMQDNRQSPELGPIAVTGATGGVGMLAVDMYETDDNVVVKTAIPGVKAEDIDVSVTGDTLTIKAETQEEEEVHGTFEDLQMNTILLCR